MSRGKWLLALLPPTHRVWGEALLAEQDYVETDRTRWMLGSVRLVTRAWTDWITRGNLTKTALTTLSIMNIVFGLFVLGLFVFVDDTPVLVLLLGLGLIIQGAYTLVFMGAGLARVEPWATRALLAGQTVALLIGVAAFTVSTVNNLDPLVGDRVFGPMAAGGVIAAQAATALYLYAIRGEPAPISR